LVVFFEVLAEAAEVLAGVLAKALAEFFAGVLAEFLSSADFAVLAGDAEEGFGGALAADCAAAGPDIPSPKRNNVSVTTKTTN